MTRISVLLLATLLLFTFQAKAENSTPDKIVVLTSDWRPYINPLDEPPSQVQQLLKILEYEHNIQFQWHFLPFQYIFKKIEGGHQALSFPWFKTPERDNVLFSDEVFSASCHLFYNRQYSSEPSIDDLAQLKVGKVKGYSYGIKIDQKLESAIQFVSEEEALKALFENRIQILPMAAGVMNETLASRFPDRLQLIRPISGYSDTSALRFMAPDNEYGAKLIKTINEGLAKVGDSKALIDVLEPYNPQIIDNCSPSLELQDKPLNGEKTLHVAKLVTAENYPGIIGSENRSENSNNYYLLPQGTRVAIVEWSEKFRCASPTDRLYKSMTQRSKVVILNGPHIGKELWIKNFHIELQ